MAFCFLEISFGKDIFIENNTRTKRGSGDWGPFLWLIIMMPWFTQCDGCDRYVRKHLDKNYLNTLCIIICSVQNAFEIFLYMKISPKHWGFGIESNGRPNLIRVGKSLNFCQAFLFLPGSSDGGVLQNRLIQTISQDNPCFSFSSLTILEMFNLKVSSGVKSYVGNVRKHFIANLSFIYHFYFVINFSPNKSYLK